MLKINPVYEDNKAKAFCRKFIHSDRPKYIFGRNEWGESIAQHIEVDGFIDDFTEEKKYLGKPIVPIEKIPKNALVVVVVIGKPIVAEKRVSQYQFNSIDYFSFYKHSKLPVKQVMFWDGMADDIKLNFVKYEWIYGLLKDQISKNQFYNIINFRLSYDLTYMRGFEAIEEKQYFESFLDLSSNKESFVDIGAYDGATSEEFIKRSPAFEKVILFEPEDQNMKKAKERLHQYKNIEYYSLGLSNKKERLSFEVNGSSSRISSGGRKTIKVDCLDNIIKEKVTFIKMDIEGAEKDALEGAREVIKNSHPKLAISVYHKKDDFWRIPELVLGIRRDYDIYLRHYTQGISETIMFFIPSE